MQSSSIIRLQCLLLQFLFNTFSLNGSMDRMTESEPMLNSACWLSSACCPGPDPYRPIIQCQDIGRIWNQKLKCPSKPGTAYPTQLISTGRRRSHHIYYMISMLNAPTNQNIPVRSFIYWALECLEPGLPPQGVQRSNNWATRQAQLSYSITYFYKQNKNMNIKFTYKLKKRHGTKNIHVKQQKIHR